MSEVVYRPALVSDAPTMAYMRSRMFLENGWTDKEGAEQLVELQSAYLDDVLSDGSAVGIIAEADGEVVGCIAGKVDRGQPSPHNVSGRTGYLMNLYVVPEHRRRGIARSLTERTIEALRERGIRMFSLWASDPARPLYESMGFEASNEMRLWPSDDQEDAR